MSISVTDSENYLAKISALESENESLRQQLNEAQLTLYEVEGMLRKERYDEAQRLLETLPF